MLFALRLSCFVAALMGGACKTQAGAWKHPVGQGFASASLTLHQATNNQQEELSFYGDYGISEHFDLGLDLHQTGDMSGHAMIFVRVPIRQPATGLRIATELAFGGNHYRGRWGTMHRISLSAGTDFATSQFRGWGNVDLRYEKPAHQDNPLWKLDAALGLHSTGRIAPMLAIETSKSRGQSLSYAIIPSLRIKLARPDQWQHAPTSSKKNPRLFGQDSELLLGLRYRNTPEQSLGLKLALWQRF